MKIVIVAGGTGGHLYPGMALARALQGHQVTFIVRRGDMGRSLLQKEGFSIKEIAGQGLPRELSLKALAFPFQLVRGWAEALMLLRRLQPDRVAGMGGYLSVPVIATARLLGIPTLLHEQNVFPGLANRLLSRWSNSVALSFPDSLLYLRGRRVWVSGLPVRPEIGTVDQGQGRQHFGLHQSTPAVLVFGGSLGAMTLNSRVLEAWRLLQKQGLVIQVLHITGTKDYERVEALYRDLGIAAKVMPYCHDMAQAYAAADAVICRAGASTVAELLAVKRPAFLIPYPYASNQHQRYNAQVIEKYGLGKAVEESVLQPAGIADFVAQALSPDGRKAFEEASAKRPPDLLPVGAASRLASRLIGNLL